MQRVVPDAAIQRKLQRHFGDRHVATTNYCHCGASALGISFCPTDASRAAEADSVPSWDLTASRRAAASAGYSETRSERVKSCLASEQRTREEITKNWSTFPAADRIGCVKSLTFSPTYTELLTWPLAASRRHGVNRFPTWALSKHSSAALLALGQLADMVRSN